MSTIQRGDTAISFTPGEKIETLKAVLDEIDRLSTEIERRRWLRSQKHFHDFGYNRTCIFCGLRDKDYMLGDDSQPCEEGMKAALP